MAEGAFVVSPEPDVDNPTDIRFSVRSGVEIPEDQLVLRDEIHRALTVLRTAFGKDEARFQQYYRPLLSLAQAGLVGQSAQPELARRALVELKADAVAREAGRVKNGYMRLLGLKAILLGAPTLLALMTVALMRVAVSETATSYLFLWLGCMAGVWLSFGARKTAVAFEQLHVLEEDRLDPVIRLIFAGILTLVFGLLLQTGAVDVALGGLSAATFADRPEVALLVGILCGFSEKLLSSRIATQAKALLGSGE